MWMVAAAVVWLSGAIVDAPAAKTSLIPRVASVRLASRKEAEAKPDIKEEGEVEKEE